jgi:hypothetical protein
MTSPKNGHRHPPSSLSPATAVCTRTSTAARRRHAASAAPAKRSSHPGKKPVLIHIPEDMHRALRQLSVEEGGEPLTVITERLLRQYLVKRGHTRFAP